MLGHFLITHGQFKIFLKERLIAQNSPALYTIPELSSTFPTTYTSIYIYIVTCVYIYNHTQITTSLTIH